MKLTPLSILRYVFFLGLAGLLLYWAFKGQDLSKLLYNLKHAHYGWILASVIACLIAHYIRAARWALLIRSLGHEVPVKNAFYAVMIGYLANLAFPRMGEVSRCGAVNKTNKVPVDQLIGTVITERLSDLVLLLSITALALLLEFNRIAGFVYQNGWLKLQALMGSTLLLWLLGFAIAMLLSGYLFRQKLMQLLQPLAKTLQGLKSGLFSFNRMPQKGRFIVLSVLLWGFYLLSTWLCFYAIDATSSLGLLAALSTLVFGSLGMIVPVQGGLGAFHWMVSEGLTLHAIPKAEGLAFATLIHSSQILVILVIGAWSVLMVVLRSSKNQ